MTGARRRVRAWATVWLVFQLAAVSAFVPRDCCAAHRAAATAAKSHDAGGHGAHHAHRPVHDGNCVMRGSCNGPLDAIATLFMAPGLPLQPFSLLDDGTPQTGPRLAEASALDGLVLPTTPPPRG